MLTGKVLIIYMGKYVSQLIKKIYDILEVLSTSVRDNVSDNESNIFAELSILTRDILLKKEKRVKLILLKLLF